MSDASFTAVRGSIANKLVGKESIVHALHGGAASHRAEPYNGTPPAR